MNEVQKKKEVMSVYNEITCEDQWSRGTCDVTVEAQTRPKACVLVDFTRNPLFVAGGETGEFVCRSVIKLPMMFTRLYVMILIIDHRHAPSTGANLRDGVRLGAEHHRTPLRNHHSAQVYSSSFSSETKPFKAKL